MCTTLFARALVIGLVLISASFIAGCEGSPVTPPPLPTPLTVTAITPSTGSTSGPTTVTIAGTGFQSGATVTIASIAVLATVVSSTAITATIPAHAAGTVDVVVTNPGGQSGRLDGAFTFADALPYAITASATTVVAGAQITVSWTAPRGGGFDWIGFFDVAAPSTSYEDFWWSYTNGTAMGSTTISAPMRPGLYEFRYLPDDGYVTVAKSAPVTVTER